MNNPMTWQSLFVGREADIEYLIQVWRCAKQGSAQLVVLLGESGLGKTRLMQEFYRWLTVHEDPPSDEAPQGYWPDAFDNANTSLDVNPHFDSSLHGRGQIPWLWWGIRFLPPEGRNQVGSRCGLGDYRHELFAHTESIGAARRLKELRKAAFWTVASDVFGNIIPYAGLVFAAKNLLSMLTGDRKREQELLEIASQSPGETARRGRIKLESLALDYFRTILDPRNREAATVPIVLFLDDAQWIDPTTLDFVFQLLHQATPSHWPLMVVCTHWEAEWYLNLRNQHGEDTTPRNLADIPRLLKLGDEWPGLRQVAPVRDLSPIVAAVLHGVTDEQRDLILRKAGGNPWLLEEILLFLIREPRLFADRSLERPLTPKGEEKVRQRSFKLHELLADRFAKLNEEVKRTLGWSSEQGTRFLREITVATARRVDPSLQEETVLSAMHEAENPNRLVQFLGDLSRFNLAEFRQAAFHHVAAEYLACDPQEQEAVRYAVRETLALWVRNGRIDELPKEERLDALLMARTSLLPSAEVEGSEWCAWGNAMVRLASLYRSEILW